MQSAAAALPRSIIGAVVAILTISLILVVYGAVSGPLDRRGITSAMVLVAVGFVVGVSGLGFLNVSIENAVAERITELALAFLLFSDSARLDLRSLRHDLGWPSRLLLIGLPLTMAAGMGAGLLVFPGMAVASAFLLSTMLCSTDAALGQRVVDDPAVPARIRQALDVESGLNDGLAVPFFLVAADISMATLHGGVPSAVIHNAAAQIGWGLVAGIGVGVAGGALLRIAEGRGWLQGHWRQVLTLAVALGAYSAAVVLGGSGFIAAFVGGMAFGRASGEHGLRVTYFTEETGGLLAAVTWIGFGALGLGWRRAQHHVAGAVVRGPEPDDRAHGARGYRDGAPRRTPADDRVHGVVRAARARVARLRSARVGARRP